MVVGRGTGNTLRPSPSVLTQEAWLLHQYLKQEAVRVTAVGRGAERDAERNAVLAGDLKCLVYYVMID